MNEYTYPQFAGDNDPTDLSSQGLYGGQSYFTGDRPTQQGGGGGYTFQGDSQQDNGGHTQDYR